jgi:hypothetical protein
MSRQTFASVDRFRGARGTGVVSAMRTKALRLDFSQGWLAPCALLLLLDCGIARGPKPEVDSESHFLGCSSVSDCGGIVGATCAGGWCVDVDTGERIGTNAQDDGNWDALPPGSSADGFPTDGPWLEGAPTATGVPPGDGSSDGSVAAPLDGDAPPPLPCYTASIAPVPPFQTQAALNRLADCETVYGDLTITFDADLRVLHSLRTLLGTFDIRPLSRHISSLAGLENLEVVSGDLRLQGVSSFAPLASLQAVGAKSGQGLTVQQGTVRDLTGLEKLTSLHNLTLLDLPELVSLAGLPSPTGMESLNLVSVPALATLPPFSAAQVTLQGTGFTNLASLQGTPIGELIVQNNPLLVDATISTVQKLRLEGNPVLSVLTLPAQAKPLESLEVIGNPSLQSIVGADSLVFLESLSVRENPVLQTINLPWVQELNTFQVIRNTNLSAIDLPLLVQAVQDLTVVSNPNLSMPSIFSITGRAKKYKLAGNQGDPLFLDPCPYIRDTFCDAPPVDSICAAGTDSYDCKAYAP